MMTTVLPPSIKSPPPPPYVAGARVDELLDTVLEMMLTAELKM